jgi:hypothetical protein
MSNELIKLFKSSGDNTHSYTGDDPGISASLSANKAFLADSTLPAKSSSDSELSDSPFSSSVSSLIETSGSIAIIFTS